MNSASCSVLYQLSACRQFLHPLNKHCMLIASRDMMGLSMASFLHSTSQVGCPGRVCVSGFCAAW